MQKNPSKIILWGGTGQAIVNRPIIEYMGASIVAVFDDTPGLKSPFEDIPIYEGWQAFLNWVKYQNKNEIGFCISIGNPHGYARLKLHEKLVIEGLQPFTIIHPFSWIAKDSIIGDGAQIMAGAIIQPKVKIGKQCIINTKASIDHECVLSDASELAPGVTLCGNVNIGINAWVCSGSTVLPRINIGDDSIIGSGSLVNKNIPSNVLAYGVPAKVIKSNHYIIKE